MNRCPHCGEYDMTWINHNGVSAEDPAFDEAKIHAYCQNCDNGVCEEC